MAESNNDVIEEIKINDKTIYVYKKAVDKLTDIINNPTQGGLEIKKNKINSDFTLKFKGGMSDASKYLERYSCQLYTYPFSNWDYKNKKEREKCTRPKKVGSNVVYIDKSNNNVLKRSTVTSIKKDIIQVNGYDNSIKSHKVIFLDNDYSKFYNKYNTKEDYKKFLTKNESNIDKLLNEYTVSGSIGKLGTSANMNLRNTFLEEIDKSTTPKPEASAQIHCNITEPKPETKPKTETEPETEPKPDPDVQGAIDAIHDLSVEIGNNGIDIESGGDQFNKAQTAIDKIANEDEKKKYQQKLDNLKVPQSGGRRRKRRTKKRSAKSRRRRRRTIKKRKSKRTKKTRKNRKTKRVRFKL